METSDIKRLIEKAVTPGEQLWADLGSGDGAFTLALQELGGPKMKIYSVDKDHSRLSTQKLAFAKQFPDAKIEFLEGDITQVSGFPPLDGILMANALHFVKDQKEFLARMRSGLKPDGKLVIVEYDTDEAGRYVPYPVPLKKLGALVRSAGFSGEPEVLGTVPSQYQGKMYGASVGK